MIHFLSEWALRSSALILAGAGLLWILRVKDSSMRLAAWTVMLAGSLLIPWMTSTLPALPIVIHQKTPATVLATLAPQQTMSAPIELEETIRSAGEAFTPGYATPAPARPFDWERPGLVAYLLVAVSMLLRLFAGLVGSLRLLKQSHATGRAADGIEIRTSRWVAAPITLGILRPVIVLPVEWDEWDHSKLEAVLAHERSHIQRRDPVVQLLSAIHRALLWFSPLSWLLHSQIVRVAEEASDDAAIAFSQDRAAYAEMLLEFMRRPALKSAVVGVSMARYARPEKRIHRILEASTISRGVTRWGALAILSLSVPLVYVAAATRPQDAGAKAKAAVPSPIVIAPAVSKAAPILVSQAQVAPPVASPARRAEFEAASIRPAEPFVPSGAGRGGGPPETGTSCGPQRLTMDATQVRFRCAMLRGLIAYAFGVPQERVLGPEWVTDTRNSPKFDIVAKLPAGSVKAQIPEMVQTLLRDRFRLSIHSGMQEGPILALLVDKGGLKLKEGLPDTEPSTQAPDAPACSPQNVSCQVNVTNADGVQTVATPLARGVTHYSNPRIGAALVTITLPGKTRLEAQNTTLAGLADLLRRVAAEVEPIVDMTGLEGRYQVVLETTVDIDGIMKRASDARDAVRAAGGSDGSAGAAMDMAIKEMMPDLIAARRKALQEELQKLGLRLESRKGTFDSIVVDRAEKMPTEN